MIQATLCFLYKEHQGEIQEVCLAVKKRGFGKDKWNGVGGKMDETIDVDIYNTARREALEEIGVEINHQVKVAELHFEYLDDPENKDWTVHVFFSNNWTHDPIETEEMKPQWFKINEIPYEQMWIDDIHWLPQVLNRIKTRAYFSFYEKEIISKRIEKALDL